MTTKDTSVIPAGFYCYDPDMSVVITEPGKPPVVEHKLCPYHSVRECKIGNERDEAAVFETDQRMIGCCAFLGKDDADFNEEGKASLLYDMIKECEIHLEWDNDQE